MERRHTDAEYEKMLKQIRERLLLMAGRVEGMIHDAIESLVQRDSELARKTIEKDLEVNQDEVETDHLCMVVLARWQPMASDLRFITLAMKMVTDLERIGDMAAHICRRALWLNERPPLKPYVDIPRMGKIVEQLLKTAVDAFVDGDIERAKEVIRRDDEIDALYRNVLVELICIMQSGEEFVERALQVQTVAKMLERIADHCTNLAEHVVFLVNGEDIRHSGRYRS
jgi:phosphate transport system protein